MKTFGESLLQSLPIGLIILNKENEIEYVNQAGEQLLEIAAAEVVGMHIDKVVLTIKGQSLLTVKPNPSLGDFNREVMVTKSGREAFLLGYTVAPYVFKQRKFTGKAIYFRDLTELQKVNADMLRMDRMTSLSKLFIGIAHEIRNPLAGIKTTAQAMEEEIDEDDPRREYLGRIIKEIDRLNTLLKSFFKFARPQPPVMAPFMVQDLINEVLFILNLRLKVRKIKVRERYDTDIPQIRGDFNQLKQVFLNLLINSIQAIPAKGGEIGIDVSLVSQDSKDKRLQIRIEDNGKGIAPDHIDRIFDPFFTTRAQGTGMGLSICYRIIQEHRGTITVESRINKGTVISTFLPL